MALFRVAADWRLLCAIVILFMSVEFPHALASAVRRHPASTQVHPVHSRSRAEPLETGTLRHIFSQIPAALRLDVKPNAVQTKSSVQHILREEP